MADSGRARAFETQWPQADVLYCRVAMGIGCVQHAPPALHPLPPEPLAGRGSDPLPARHTATTGNLFIKDGETSCQLQGMSISAISAIKLRVPSWLCMPSRRMHGMTQHAVSDPSLTHMWPALASDVELLTGSSMKHQHPSTPDHTCCQPTLCAS